MKALTLTRYGDNSAVAIADVPKPGCGPGEVLVEVAYAGVNPVDFKTRDGLLKVIHRLRFPCVMGNELAGTVAEVGDGVKGFSAGDEVYGRVNKKRMGTFAEFATVDADDLAPKPTNVEMAVAAGIPLVALTAWQALYDYGRLGEGHKVLIHAGAGSVGRIAIQLAKRVGADVATTVSPRGVAVVEALGANTVIDYRQERFEDRVQDYDFVLDTVGGETLERSFAVVRRGGRVCSIAGLPEPNTADDLDAGWWLRTLFWLVSRKYRGLARRHGAEYRYLFMRPSGAQLREIAALCEAGTLTVDIDRSFMLDEATDALTFVETGKAFGKVVLQIAGAA